MAFKSNITFDLSDIISEEPIVDAPFTPPISFAVAEVAFVLLGPVAALPALGWWAAKQFK